MRFDQLESLSDEEMTPERMVELVRHFYMMGFMRDQGGGIAVRVPSKRLIYCSPTQIQKEQWNEKDLFVWSETENAFLSRPENPNKTPSSPLGLIRATGANCVIHTHSKHAVLLTKLIPGQEFVISDQEMLVGIHNRSLPGVQNFQNVDVITVPIVEAKPNEVELGPPIRAALAKYPDTSAVLVRGHGVFCFGFGITWQRTKMMLECYEYLFEMGCMMINSGVPLTTRRLPPQTMIPLRQPLSGIAGGEPIAVDKNHDDIKNGVSIPSEKLSMVVNQHQHQNSGSTTNATFETVPAAQ